MKPKDRIDENREMIRKALDMAYGSYIEIESRKPDQWRDQSISQIGNRLQHEVNDEVMKNLSTGDFGVLIYNAMDVIKLGAMLLARTNELMDYKKKLKNKMEYKIIKIETGKELTTEELAIQLYEEGARIVYSDIEGIAKIGNTYYLLDECGNWEYIDTQKYKLIPVKG